MTLDKLKPGMTVYAIHSYQMGNTTLKSTGIWIVKVIAVNTISNTVVASLNTNPPATYKMRDWSKWRLKKPVMVRNFLGQQRIATRQERKEMALS